MTAATPPIVVVLAKAFPPVLGGVETYSEQVVRAYLRAEYDVVVLTQTAGSGGWSERQTPDGSFRLWNTGPGNQAVVFRRMARQARRIRRVENVRAVHATTWRVGVVGALAFSNAPQVVTVHGREVLNFPLGTGWAMRRVLRRADRVLCVSSATRAIAIDAVEPRDPTRFVVAHNGLTDVRGEQPQVGSTAGGAVRILSLCRLVPRKNVRNAVEALGRLQRDTLDGVEFEIAGRGPELPAIAEAIEHYGLQDVVSILGYVDEDDVPALYRSTDIFVHPHSHVGEGTDFEGFGIAIADAMAYGCAVISGKDGGPADFVIDGVTGLLVDGNNPDAIADALSDLIKDAGLRQKLSRNGREYAMRNFSWDRHIVPALTVFGTAKGLVS